jgi:hypothetical protein
MAPLCANAQNLYLSTPIPGSGQYNADIPYGSATGLIVPPGANHASICIAGTANYTTDGTVPTDLIGSPINNICLEFYGVAVLQAFQITDSSSSGKSTMTVQYFVM